LLERRLLLSGAFRRLGVAGDGCLARAAGRTHARRCARLIAPLATEREHAESADQHHHDDDPDGPQDPLSLSTLRVAFCLSTGSELRQLTFAGAFGHPSTSLPDVQHL